MICCIPFCGKDQLAALRLLHWIADLGGCANHRCLLSVDEDVRIADLLQCKEIALESFDSVEVASNGKHVEGWIPGANSLFETAAKYCRKEPFFWLEPDATPLKHGWLDKLQAEYWQSDKRYLGALVSHEIPGWPNPYMEGVGIYPGDTWGGV